jgi:GT2 family glycosyltransferase
MKGSLVYILILNYCSPEDCIECIAAVRRVGYPNLRLLVMDNASADNSVEQLRPLLKPDEFLVLPRNDGYAGGNNEGIRIALANGADYIFVINPDVRINPDSISSYVAMMEAEPSLSALNPIQLTSDGHTMDELFRREMFDYNGYETPSFPLTSHQSWEVRALFGAALFLRRDTVEKVGGFDPLYFAYWEEVDLCRRIRYHGGRLVVTSTEPVTHLRSYVGSPDPFIRFLRLRGMYLYKLKDLARPYPKLLLENLLELAKNTLRPNKGEFKPNEGELKWYRSNYIRVLWWCVWHANKIRLHRKLDRLGRTYV